MAKMPVDDSINSVNDPKKSFRFLSDIATSPRKELYGLGLKLSGKQSLPFVIWGMIAI